MLELKIAEESGYSLLLHVTLFPVIQLIQQLFAYPCHVPFTVLCDYLNHHQPFLVTTTALYAETLPAALVTRSWMM